MQQISAIQLAGVKLEKQVARQILATRYYDITARFAQRSSCLPRLNSVSLRDIDRKVKQGNDLTFNESYIGMCHVVAATNKDFYEYAQGEIGEAFGAEFTPERAIACGTSFMQMMALKESFSQVTPEEIAGIAAASMLDAVVQLPVAEVIETCGMGGDKGFGLQGEIRKTINASTLSAIVLASLKLPVIKHGSYGNTSAVGSTEAIESFGARTNQESLDEVMSIFQDTHFSYLDAHWCKTIHDLSHLLLMETINHLAGPMSLPILPTARLTKIMGVNEKVYPGSVARAYALLHSLGIQSMGGVAIVAGLDRQHAYNPIDPKDERAVRAHAIVDELSPYGSAVSFAHEEKYLGTFLVNPSLFGVEVDPDKIQVQNTREAIKAANVAALMGQDRELAKYLAMNAALGLVAHRDLVQAVGDELSVPHFTEAFNECFEVIMSQGAWSTLKDYVEATGGTLISR